MSSEPASGDGNGTSDSPPVGYGTPFQAGPFPAMAGYNWELHREQSWHRGAAFMAAHGAGVTKIGRALGKTPQTISNLIRASIFSGDGPGGDGGGAARHSGALPRRAAQQSRGVERDPRRSQRTGFSFGACRSAKLTIAPSAGPFSQMRAPTHSCPPLIRSRKSSVLSARLNSLAPNGSGVVGCRLGAQARSQPKARAKQFRPTVVPGAPGGSLSSSEASEAVAGILALPGGAGRASLFSCVREIFRSAVG